MDAQSVGKRLGFFAALMLFSTIMYFILSRLGLIAVEYVYFIAAVAVVHVVYSLARSIKNE